MAAKKGRCEQILGYLVGKEADINIKDKNGVNICYCTTKSRLVLFSVFVLNSGGRAMFITDCVCQPSKFKAHRSILQFSCN